VELSFQETDLNQQFHQQDKKREVKEWKVKFIVC